MAHIAPPGHFSIAGQEVPIVLDALPDPFDARDYQYRPRLVPLPSILDPRDCALPILLQEGGSCTGHAVATVLNTVLAYGAKGKSVSHVSPYMLYRLGRRYDEFAGEDDIGSSLRGVFKGWFHHGVVPAEDWPTLRSDHELDEPELLDRARLYPPGTFYRINPYNLDDMHSAIYELNALAASCAIHEGWKAPVRSSDSDTPLIKLEPGAPMCGGHAFAIVGYNQVGFLVQNSWGDGWGERGFAILTYEDWLQNAYDAWVARPGVPKTPFASTHALKTLEAGRGSRAATANPQQLAFHLVSLGNNGTLSPYQKAASSPPQVERLFKNMEETHGRWLERGTARRHIVLYAHGGLVAADLAASTAERHRTWWLNNHIYPIYFAWQSGVTATLLNQFSDLMSSRLPPSIASFDPTAATDRLAELVARQYLIGLWDEMKENARAASDPIRWRWSLDSPLASALPTALPGATLVAYHLRQYIERHGARNVAIHLVGHSAGAIFQASFLARLASLGVHVESLAFLAAALRVDAFGRDVLPLLGASVRHFANFVLSDEREANDSCGVDPLPPIYHKSLLYLVSRALERRDNERQYETPLVGMARFLDNPLPGQGDVTLREAVHKAGGHTIIAPSLDPTAYRSDAQRHGGFANDNATMTSLLLQMVGATTISHPNQPYSPNAPLLETAR